MFMRGVIQQANILSSHQTSTKTQGQPYTVVNGFITVARLRGYLPDHPAPGSSSPVSESRLNHSPFIGAGVSLSPNRRKKNAEYEGNHLKTRSNR